MKDRFPGLNLYRADPAQYLITVDEDLDDLGDDLDRDLYELRKLKLVPTA